MTVLRHALDSVLARRSLDESEMRAVLDEILEGGAPPALVAGLLVALRMKGEEPRELAAGVRALLARARRLELGADDLLDTAGTGGDGKGTFNISTAAALIAAAAGIKVAKAGNRAASGAVGAADVLEQFGVRIELEPAALRRCLERAGICFVFAPYYHPAVARVAPIRKQLGVPTLFNLLGPIANAAQPARRLVGVAEARTAPVMAQALVELGARHALVVHSEDGMDEISPCAPTMIFEVRGGKVTENRIRPADFGINGRGIAEIRATNAEQAVARLCAALGGESGAASDVLALNGGAAIYVGAGAASLAEGVEAARAVLRQGLALNTLERLRAASHEEQ